MCYKEVVGIECCRGGGDQTVAFSNSLANRHPPPHYCAIRAIRHLDMCPYKSEDSVGRP